MTNDREIDNRSNVGGRGVAIGLSLGVFASALVLVAAKPGHAEQSTASPTESVAESSTETSDDSIRDITIEMESLSFEPTSISVTAGETVRFVLKNTGDIPHEFTIGTPLVQQARRAVMRELFDADILQEYLADAPEREGPNSVVILGGDTRELIWTFTETQDIEFGCNLPLHYEAGMRGDIHVAVPKKNDAVASHNHGAGSGTADTNGLANLAQLMAKAKETVAAEADTGTTTESEQSEKEPEQSETSDNTAASDASGAPKTGDIPDTNPATTTDQPETPAPSETVAATNEAEQPEGDQSEEENGEEKETVNSTAPESTTVSVAARAPEYKAFDRGLALMSEGDILGARKEFERSATAEAALALGRSYDENYLSRIENPNAKPDAATARQWYEAWYRISVRQGGNIRRNKLGPSNRGDDK